MRNIADYETELQEEMFKEFDQSTFNLGLQGFRNSLFLTPNYISDCSQPETDPSFYLSNVITDTNSPHSTQVFKKISERIKTPVRIRNTMGIVTNIDYV